MHCKAIALGFLAAATGAFAAEDSDVVQLQKDTFTDFIKGNDLVLAECEYTSSSPPRVSLSNPA
jgi:hypothetical protein